MGCLLPLLALLGAAGGAGSSEDHESCGGSRDVGDAANGTIQLPAARGPASPNRTCTWVIAALPSEDVRLEIKALEAAAHPSLSVDFEGSPGEGLSGKGPMDPGHSFLLTGKGRTVIRGRLDAPVTVTYWVAVDRCARLALCCAVQGSAQTCFCPGNWTGERCRTGVAVLGWPRPLWEGAGQVESHEDAVRLSGPVLSGATEHPHSTIDAALGTRPSLPPRQGPAAQPASTEESRGGVLRDAATVPQTAWLGRRRKGASGGTNAAREEPLVTAEPWDKAGQLDMRMRLTPTGRAGSPLSQVKAAAPTSVPIPGAVPVGNIRGKVATSPGGSIFQTEPPPVVPSSVPGEVSPWNQVPSGTSPGMAAVYTSGESALPPGASAPRSVETPRAALGLSEPREETSQGRAADVLGPVTLVSPSAPLSTGVNGTQPFGGGAQGAGRAPGEAAVTAHVELTELGVGASLPAPTGASGPDLSRGTLAQVQTEVPIHTLASTAGNPWQTSRSPAQQPAGGEGLTWELGGRAASQAHPGAETGRTSGRPPDNSMIELLATPARPGPGVQPTVGASTQHRVPLGTQGPGEGLDPTLAGAGSEQAPGPRGVDIFPGNMDLSHSNETHTEGAHQAVSGAESFAGASPDRAPTASARSLQPFANLSAPAPSSGSVQPPLPLEQLSTWAGVSHPSARGQNVSLSERTPGPSLSTRAPALERSSSDSQPRAWLPDTPPEKTRVFESAASVGTSSHPPVSSSLRAKQPSLAPAPGRPVTSQLGMSPGASHPAPSVLHSPGSLPDTGAPLPSQTAQPDLQAATLQGESTARSLTATPAPPGPEPSSPSSLERNVSGSPPVPGLSARSMATTQSPAWAPRTPNAALAASSPAGWPGETTRMGQEAVTPLAWSEPGDSSQAPDAPASGGAGGSFSSSSMAALFSPTAPDPELILTAGSTRPPAGSRSPQPPVAVTLRAWGADATDPTRSTRATASSPVRVGMPPATPGPAGATDVQPPPSTTKGTRGRAQSVFVVEDQPPLLKAAVLRLPCELALDMEFVRAFQTPASHARRSLVWSFNATVTPLFAAVPGFQRLEVKTIRAGSVVLEYDALFAADQVRWQAQGLGALVSQMVQLGAARPGPRVANATVLWNVVLEQQLDLCAVLFSCQAGFECFSSGDDNASCTSVCHRDYCKNRGICTHPRDQPPVCQCPSGSDYWFMGLRCDYRVTQQSLLGMACGALLTVALVGAAVACLVIRRFKALLREAREDQTRSSYRQFCRLDDVSAHYWSQPWLASTTSLDNPGFSTSEELLHLQRLENSCCGCKDDLGGTGPTMQWPTPPGRAVCRPSFHYDWDTSSNSINDPMTDSGKASDISVSSWPMEPTQWTPFPLLHQLSRPRPPKTRRPHSYCEGTELVNLERSWTA